MNQRTFLGITHNPFVPPKEGFFDGADRRSHLDHLRHLSRWSRRILIVTGPFGVGKSTLFKELSSNLEPSTKGARLAGTVVNSEREVLAALLTGFGVAADAEATPQQLADAVVRHTVEQMEQSRVCLVMIDDGHLLEPAALTRLVEVVAGSNLRMVLFAEASIVGGVERATKKHEIEWFELRLSGFPKADVRNYLEWRFSQALYRGRLPFTEEQVSRIASKSAGNPGVVDSIASNLLIEMETGEITRRERSFPVVHATLAVLLAVLVGLIYLFVQGPDPEEVAEAVPEPATFVEEPRIEEPVDPGPVDGLEVAEPTQPDEPVEEVIVEAIADTAGDGVAQDTEVPDVLPEPDVVETEVAEISEPEPVIEEPDPIPVIERDTSADEEWILSQNPDRYTLQLVTVSSLDRAEALIEGQADPGSFAIYTIRRGERTLYVIVQGVYRTSSAARHGVYALRGDLQGLDPWIRRFEMVQGAVRANR